MIVDVHAHYFPRAYSEAHSELRGRKHRESGLPESDDEIHIEQRLQMMDEAGVRLQVLSPAGGRDPYSGDEQASVNAARICNDHTAALVSRYPDRFKAFVTVPLPHVDASLRELRRGMDELGMIGLNLHISALDRSVAEDEFLPLY